jgi:hypothetical protein
VLAATYGILLSGDFGKSWHHVCETAFTDPAYELDTVVAMLPKGGVLVGTADKLSRASSPMCDFRDVLGTDESEGVPDFTVDANGAVVAVVASSKGPTQAYWLEQSVDSGLTFEQLGTVLPSSLSYAMTVDVAPSDPNRIYVSGLGLDGEGVLLRSDDRARSFVELSIPTDARSDELPFIAAVDPQDADRLYVRTDAWRYDDTSGFQVAGDALLYSEDGGENFSELIRASGKLFGFALSPDGEDVLVGYGDPIDPGRRTEASVLGVYRASAGTSTFEQLFVGPISCLTWTSDGIFACTSAADLGFSLGLADPEKLMGGDTAPFTAVLSLVDNVAPLTCRGCQSTLRCSRSWPSTCASWGRSDCYVPRQESSEAAECPGTPPRADAPSSCACRAAGTCRPNGSLEGLLLLSLAWALSTRRRRKIRPTSAH